MGSVTNIPFTDESFDVVACYEVLEHLPYENFHTSLCEIFRVSSSYAILSLPDASRVYRIDVQIPKIGEIKRLFYLPRRKMPVHNFDGEHYWEIGKFGYPLKKIIEDIQAGFEVKKNIEYLNSLIIDFSFCVN